MSLSAALLAAVLAAPPAAAGNLCALCHPDVRVQFERSIHHSEEVSCVSCHGGDPTASTVEGAHHGRFRGSVPRREIPALCASCHADTEMMRAYSLSTDQYALYQTSGHGHYLAKGDENVAVCTDCHGLHDIRRVDDPASGTYVLNIPATCARCHSDPSLMTRYGWTRDPLADFTGSVHGQALLKNANTAAPQCSRCHGAHGAAPPGVGSVDKVCGQCHATARAQFLDSPHRSAMREAGLPECASCHDHHRIARSSIDQLDSVCLDCHAADSEPAALARKMKTLFTGASEEIDRAHRIVEEAAAIPLYMEDYEARLEEARTSLLESLPAMHSLDLGRVEQLTGRARSIGSQIESEVNGILEERGWKGVALGIFWFYLIVTVAILVRFRSRAAREAGS